MKLVAAFVPALVTLLATAAIAIAQSGPAAPSTLILELNPNSASPSPHTIKFAWLVGAGTEHYGWEVERGVRAPGGTIDFAPFASVDTGLSLPGEFATVLDDTTEPGVEVCFRVRAVTPSMPGAWSESACGDLANPPAPLPMDVAAEASAEVVAVSWQATPGADVGYLLQVSRFNADDRREWLGSNLGPPGEGRLTAEVPIGTLGQERACFRVMPISSGTVNGRTSEETCIDLQPTPTTTPTMFETASPTPSVTSTPGPPATGSGSTETGGPLFVSGLLLGLVLLFGGLAAIALTQRPPGR